MSEEIVEVHARIKGQVQGVGFRGLVRQHAIRLGIIGMIRNLADGDVELQAKGKRQVIQELFTVIKELQSPIKVFAISFEEISPQNHYVDFKILF